MRLESFNAEIFVDGEKYIVPVGIEDVVVSLVAVDDLTYSFEMVADFGEAIKSIHNKLELRKLGRGRIF